MSYFTGGIKNFLESSSVACVATTLDFEPIFINSKFEKTFGAGIMKEGLLKFFASEFQILPEEADDFIRGASDIVGRTHAKSHNIYDITSNPLVENIHIISFLNKEQAARAKFHNDAAILGKVFHDSTLPVVLFDKDSFQILYFNHAFIELAAMPAEHVANLSVKDIIQSKKGYIFDKGKYEKQFIANMARPDKPQLILEIMPADISIENQSVVLFKVNNITEQVEQQASSLATGTAGLSLLFYNPDDAVIISENMIITDVNHETCVAWGYDYPAEMIGKRLQDIFKQGSVDLSGANSSSEWVSFTAIKRDGKTFKGEKNTKILISNNRVLHIMALKLHDGKKSGAATRHASFEHGVLDAQPNLVMVYDDADTLIKCNKSMLTFFNSDNTEAFVEKYGDISRLFIKESGFLSGGEAGSSWFMPPYENPRKEYRVKLLDKEGEPKIFSVHTNVITKKSFSYTIVSLTDITETVQQNYILIDVNNMLKEQNDAIHSKLTNNMELLVQQSKMAAMGEMIGVITHQWKQPLNTIGLIAQNLEEMVRDDETDKKEIVDLLQSILKHVLFMSETVDNFRDFFRKNASQVFFPVVRTIESTLALLKPLMVKHRVKIETNYEKGSENIYILGFPNDFKQVFMNIIINAKDSINSKISKCSLKDGDGTIKISVSKADKYLLELTFSDNGAGLSESALENIFKLNFTTKGEQGTGIGTYMAKMIIDKAGGEITAANNADGVGAKITIKLPMVDNGINKRTDA